MNRLILVAMAVLVVACSGGEKSPEPELGVVQQAVLGPVAAYAFEEGSGGITNENSGNAALKGNIYMGATWTTNGKHGKALVFGSPSALYINDATILHLSTGMTLSAWVNPTSPVNDRLPIIAKRSTTGTPFVWELNGNDALNRPRGEFSHGAAVFASGGSTLTPGVWTYLATTYDGTNLKTYKDGVLLATTASTQTIDSNTQWVEIGSNDVESAYARATIDDVRIYDHALTLSELNVDMNTGVGQTPADASADADALAPDADATAHDADALAPDVDALPPPVDAGSSVFPLKLVSGKRYLADKTDKPFLIQGDAVWSLIAGAVDADVETYLEDRRTKGFNAIVVNLIEHKFVASPPNNAYGVAPFTTPGDFSTPNEAYFAFADTVIQKANSKNILVILFPAYLGYPGTSEGWSVEMGNMSTATLTAYGNYLGNRYKVYPNIMWANSGDDPTPNKPAVDAIAAGIKATDSVHLHTAHPYDLSTATAFYGTYPWLDVDCIYQQEPSINLATIAAYNATTRPTFLIETWYENSHGITNQTARQEAYEPLLGGAFGQFFGTQAVRLLDPGWQSNLNTIGTQDMVRLHTFFGPRHWELLMPDQGGTFLTSGYGSGTTRASAARASDGSWGLVYVPSSRNMTVDLAGFSHAVNGKWFDPTNGSFLPLQCSPFNNCGPLSVMSTPGNNSAGGTDWLLVFE